MSISQLAVKSQVNRWNDELGVEEWVLGYTVPNAWVRSNELNFRVSLANLLPGADHTDIYAPCIHRSNLVPDPQDANSQILTILYRRPGDAMILQPGRGLLRFSTYSTTKKEETAVYRDGRDYTRQTTDWTKPEEATWASWTVTLERRETLTIEERGIVIVQCADWAIDELALYARAFAWIGMGGEFKIGGEAASYPSLPSGWADRRGPSIVGGLLFDNLKLMRVDIQRKDNDASVVFSTWQFARNPEGWKESGIVSEQWAVSDRDGNVTFSDLDGARPVFASGSYMALKLHNADPDVIRGKADFSAMQDYFKWMK